MYCNLNVDNSFFSAHFTVSFTFVGYDRNINGVKFLVSGISTIDQYNVFENFLSRLVNNTKSPILSVAFDCREKNVLWSENGMFAS